MTFLLDTCYVLHHVYCVYSSGMKSFQINIPACHRHLSWVYPVPVVLSLYPAMVIVLLHLYLRAFPRLQALLLMEEDPFPNYSCQISIRYKIIAL